MNNRIHNEPVPINGVLVRHRGHTHCWTYTDGQEMTVLACIAIRSVDAEIGFPLREAQRAAAEVCAIMMDARREA